jgi:hypothetical protein
MPNALIAALCSGFLALVPAAAVAQIPSTEADRTLRQGDSIEWVSVSGGTHQVRFGGNVGGTTLTKIADVQAILSFPPAPAPQLTINGDIGSGPPAGTGLLLQAKVKDDAIVGATFIFTCGIHPNGMISQQFKVAAKDPTQPARTIKIKGVTGMHWRLEAMRDVHVDTTP